MHEYYRKNIGKIRKRMDRYLKAAKSEIEGIFGKPYDDAFSEIWEYYEAKMLDVLPYIGGGKVSGTKNLTGCMFFVSIGVVGRKHGLSLQDWGRLSTTIYERYFARCPRLMRIAIPYLIKRHPRTVYKMLRLKDRRNGKNAAQNPGSFVTRAMEPTEVHPLIYHNLHCPVHDFCKSAGYMDYLPYLCNLDYVMFKAFDLSLQREKTCGTQDGLCDFKISRNAPIPPVWPPHILDDTDPLK